MKVNRRLFSLNDNLDSIVAALLGFMLIQVYTRHSGIGISPDSVTYISASRNFLAGRGFISYDLLPVVNFPLAYPFFLSVLSWITQTDPSFFGNLLNGFLFAALLYTCGSIMNGFENRSGWYKRIILCCIICCWALQEVYSYLWSETIFLIQILFFILSFSRYLRTSKLTWLVLSALICALASITRYAGVFLVFSGVSMIFINRDLPLKTRIYHCFFYSIISISFFCIQIFRNFKTTGQAMGPREKGNQGFLSNMSNFGDVISDWLHIDHHRERSIFLAVLIFCILIVAITHHYLKQKKVYRIEYVSSFTGLTYCGFLILAATLSRFEQFTNRFLAPMLIPFIWSLSFWIPAFIRNRSVAFKIICLIPILIITAFFLNIQLGLDYENYDGVKDAGIPGYTEDPFVNSQIVQFIKNNKTQFKQELPIYSNASDAVWFVTGLKAFDIPRSYFPNKVEKYYTEKNNYLIWFYNLENDELPDLKTVLAHKNLSLVKEFSDGVIYYAN